MPGVLGAVLMRPRPLCPLTLSKGRVVQGNAVGDTSSWNIAVYRNDTALYDIWQCASINIFEFKYLV